MALANENIGKVFYGEIGDPGGAIALLARTISFLVRSISFLVRTVSFLVRTVALPSDLPQMHRLHGGENAQDRQQSSSYTHGYPMAPRILAQAVARAGRSRPDGLMVQIVPQVSGQLQ